jgi:hypothetical protein
MLKRIELTYDETSTYVNSQMEYVLNRLSAILKLRGLNPEKPMTTWCIWTKELKLIFVYEQEVPDEAVLLDSKK